MNILFLIAHPDDEAFGPHGTISMLSKHATVHVVCMCNGARPGSREVALARQRAFEESVNLAGAQGHIHDNPDLGLTYDAAVTIAEHAVSEYSPSIVYTHNISDLNKDHKLVAEAAMVATRPKPNSHVNELYFFEVPSSTDWTFNQVHPAFEPNVYVNVSEYIDKKKQALELYTTETYQFPDARSVESMITRAKYRGSQVGVEYAESFKLVFKRS